MMGRDRYGDTDVEEDDGDLVLEPDDDREIDMLSDFDDNEFSKLMEDVEDDDEYDDEEDEIQDWEDENQEWDDDEDEDDGDYPPEEDFYR